MPTSPFTPDQLAARRRWLVSARDALVADVEGLAADSAVDADAAQATDAQDAARSVDEALASSDNDGAIIEEIDRALRRIDRADPCPYGICEATGAPIERERLDLMPWTALCARAATEAERGAIPLADARRGARR
jgi:RNA polymerase-binding transcription factor DksA